MKLGRYRESSKQVAICDLSILFGFANPTSTEIPRIKKSVFVTGAKSRAWYER